MSRSVPFLEKEVIEGEVLALLNQFGYTEPPIPYETIIERDLELVLDVDDLRNTLGYSDVLGATYVSDRKVVIDSRLENDPRFPFTCAHEIGHWVLHRQYFEDDPNQLLLFEIKRPSVVCRKSQEKEPIEWQADYFAANLLMPRRLFCASFQELCCKYALNQDRSLWEIRDEVRFSSVISDITNIFGTSKDSARVRVEELDLVVDQFIPSLL